MPRPHAIWTLDLAPHRGGGIAALMEAAADGLHLAGAAPVILTRDRTDDARARDATLPYPVHRLWGRSWRRWGGIWGRLQLPSLLRSLRPVVVHCARWEDAGIPLALAPSAGFEVWIWTHAKELLMDPGDGGAARSRLLGAAHRILATHAFGAARLGDMGVDPSRIATVCPALTARFVARQGDGASFRRRHRLRGPLLLTVGRLVPRKGHLLLLEAVARLSHLDPTWIIVGEGPEEGALRQAIAARGMEARARLMGPLPEEAIADAYAAADVFVQVSRALPGGDVEGFGLVYAEAGWHGLPVVAGRSGGVADAVIHEETGLVVDDPGDASQVTHALGRLLRDPALRRRLGAEGRRRAAARCHPRALGEALLALTPGHGAAP